MTLEPRGKTKAELASTSPGPEDFKRRNVPVAGVCTGALHLMCCKAPRGHHQMWVGLATVRSLGDVNGVWVWKTGPGGAGCARCPRAWDNVWTGPQKHHAMSATHENQP